MDPNNTQQQNAQPIREAVTPVAPPPPVAQPVSAPVADPMEAALPTKPAEALAPSAPIMPTAEPMSPVAPPVMPASAPEPTFAPTQPPTATPAASAAPANPQMPEKDSNKKGIILMIILLILIAGMGYYVFFAKGQMDQAKKAASENASVVTAPKVTVTPVVTPATIDEVEIASPDAELNLLDKDVQGL